MTIYSLEQKLQKLANFSLAESYDNVGLLVGNGTQIVKGILVCLDSLQEVLDEAIEKKCNVIIAFHPILFSPLKKITGKNYVEKTLLKAIKNDIAIISVHTALDNIISGANARICKEIGLTNLSILMPKTNIIKKLLVYVPDSHWESVREALFKVGAGNLGNYDNCSFSLEGVGTFRPNTYSKPFIGKSGVFIQQKEKALSVIFPYFLQSTILKTLFETHPYEEVAYEVTTLENANNDIGSGMLGELQNSMEETSFLKKIKELFKVGCIKHSKLLGKSIKKVAVLGGSGAFGIESAIKSGADCYISSDFKYHDFFKAEGKIVLVDIGHYESEQFNIDLIYEFIKKEISLPVYKTTKNTNPVYYL